MVYLESGYNGNPWIRRSSNEDLFYFDMKLCGSSKSFENEIDAAIDGMRKKYASWKFLDDGSLISQVLKPRLRPPEILSTTASDYFDSEFWNYLNSEYQIFNKKDLAFLTLSKNLSCPVLWPLASGLIINASYSRDLQKSLDIPYWVYVESERFHKLRLCCQELKLDVFPDLIKLTPQLMRSFFLHPLHLSLFSQKCYSEPHNDLIERQIWKLLLLSQDVNLYPTEWVPEKDYLTAYSMEKVAQFPIHSFLSKYFNYKNNLHPKEQAWYGSPE